ncbi:uncharacterized protein LOC143845966 isoform X2 [Tasmannia lanceolata]
MSRETKSSDKGEFETAIAAAAFAITTLEEADFLNQKRLSTDKSSKPSLTKSMSKKEEASMAKTKTKKDDSGIGQFDYGRFTRQRFTGEASMKKPEVEPKLPEKAAPTAPEKVNFKAPSLRKPPTFTEKYQDYKTGSTKSEGPKPNASSPVKPTTTQADSDRGKADTWEKAEMAKIKTRYEKQRTTILSWENEKKTNARRRLDRKERELEKRRATASQEYRNEIARIDKIAGGAKALTEERKRNEESKTREKAKKIRTTGRIPATCFCF